MNQTMALVPKQGTIIFLNRSRSWCKSLVVFKLTSLDPSYEYLSESYFPGRNGVKKAYVFLAVPQIILIKTPFMNCSLMKIKWQFIKIWCIFIVTIIDVMNISRCGWSKSLQRFIWESRQLIADWIKLLYIHVY